MLVQCPKLVQSWCSAGTVRWRQSPLYHNALLRNHRRFSSWVRKRRGGCQDRVPMRNACIALHKRWMEHTAAIPSCSHCNHIYLWISSQRPHAGNRAPAP